MFFNSWYFRVRVFSACDKKFSVQSDPDIVQRKYIFRIYISRLTTAQSSSPYKVVLVSTSMVIVIVLLIHVSACSPKLSCGNMRSNILCVKTRWLHGSPGLVITYFLVAQSYSPVWIVWRKRTVVHGGEREPQPEVAVGWRKTVTFVTWPDSRTDFLF